MTRSTVSADRTKWAQRLGLGNRELRAWAMYDWANSAFDVVTGQYWPVRRTQRCEQPAMH